MTRMWYTEKCQCNELTPNLQLSRHNVALQALKRSGKSESAEELEELDV